MNIINKRIDAIAIKEYKGNNSAFAKAMGTSEANIRNYRKETMPKLDFLVKLHEVFEISFDSLLSEKKTSQKPKITNDRDATIKEELDYKMLTAENDLLREKVKFQQEQIDFFKNKIEFLSAQISTDKALNAKEIEDGLNIIDEIESISLKKSTKLVK